MFYDIQLKQLIKKLLFTNTNHLHFPFVLDFLVHSNLLINGYMDSTSSQSGIIFPLSLTQLSAHSCPSNHGPYIFLHCAQFLIQTPVRSCPAAYPLNKNNYTFIIHCN